MPTIAELEIRVDSTPTEKATKALNDFASAADKAAQAGKAKVTVDREAAAANEITAKSEKNLSEVIDYQARKLATLKEQRRELNKSDMRSTAPEEFRRLNSILDANIALVYKQGTAKDVLNAKEERGIEKLNAVVAGYDKVSKATLEYDRNIAALNKGYDNGLLSTVAYNKALADQAAQLEKVKAAQPGSSQSVAAGYENALNKLVPYRVEMTNLAAQEKILQQQRDAGSVKTPAQIAEWDRATAAIASQRKEYERRIKAGNEMGISAKQEQAALRGLPAQFTDVVVSLQGGQNPLTVLLQQGGQVKDMFGGIVPAFKAVSTAVLSMISPLTVGVAAITALGVAAYQGSQEFTNLQRSLVKGGGFSGATLSDLLVFQTTLDKTAGTASDAAEALTLLEASGKISKEVFVSIGAAAIQMREATGQSIQDTVEDFASLGKDPVDSAVRLNEKYKFLTASVLAQAEALARAGEEQKATILLQSQMSDAASDSAERIIDKAGGIERAYRGVKGAILETWNVLKDLGRTDDEYRLADLTAREAALKAELDRNKNGNFLDKAMSRPDVLVEAKLKETQTAIAELKKKSDKEASEEAIKNARIEADRKAAVSQDYIRRIAAGYGTASQKAQAELDKIDQKQKEVLDAGVPNKDQMDLYTKARSVAQTNLDKAKEAEAAANKPKTDPAQTQEVVEVKSNLTALEAEYDGYYKRVTALGKANIVTQEATVASQQAILEAEKKAISENYDAQIKAIQALQGKKTNSAATNISLDNQVTKAEAAKVAALEKLNTRQEVLADQEKGRLSQRSAAIAAYADAMQLQVDNIVEQGERQAKAVGQGARQGKLNEDLRENDRNFEKNTLSLAKRKDEMDPIEYAANLKAATQAHDDMRNAIINNDRQIAAAEADWTNGVTRAYEDYADKSRDLASTVEGAITGAFSSMEDAMAEFATTGKLNFRSLANSIISDMAKIAAKQATSSALSSLFGMALGAYGGGANGFASGSAAAASSSAGASQAGYANLSNWNINAKGGAFTGGLKYFANGGAFTNSIVSSPTEFGMSNGQRGVMGEAGPEAIMPLSRTSDGSLGVRMTGGTSTSTSNSGGVQVNISISDSGVSSKTEGGAGAGFDQFGKEIGDFVDARYRVLIGRDLRDGGAIKTAMSGR
jgi:lambda family phage tail tape measure protein